MGKFYNPILSEEQMAAYLDGMLSAEENEMVENITASDPIMGEILNVVDSIDMDLIVETDSEVPIECLADDFTLPVIDSDNPNLSDSSFNEEQEYFDEGQDYTIDNVFESEDLSFSTIDDFSVDDII